MAQCEVRPECKEHFDRIDQRLEEGDDEFKDHADRIKGVEKDTSHLTANLHAVVAALWAIALLAFSSLLAFVFWFLETYHK